jgi:glycosyltransferase involved in cell wall biosynthesis
VRVLMVSPYPPLRDGIAAYALQLVAALRAQGHDVEVLSPTPSAAHHHLDLQSPSGPRALARIVRNYDKLIIQFHPEVFYLKATTAFRHAAMSLALLSAVRAARQSEVFVHEIDYRAGGRRGLDGVACRRLWRSVDRLLVHTEVERRDLIEAFGLQPDRVAVTAHGAHFVRRTSMTREAARRSLGIPQDELVFLAIGFIQPHKGFDRAVRAFAGLGRHGSSLHVVGSVRVDEPGYLAYLDELQELVESTPGAHLHNQYVSDELFDRWLVASDVVVLPYRNIWSSGVLERALLYERRVITTAVGGLSHQAGERPGVTIVEEHGLPAAMRRELGDTRALERLVGEPWPDRGEALRERIQQEVAARAGRRRGPLAATGGHAGSGPHASPGVPHGGAGARGPSQPVQRLAPLVLPPPISRRPGFSFLKRVVRGATAFEVDPLVDQVNALREATIKALERQGQLEGEGEAAAEKRRR